MNQRSNMNTNRSKVWEFFSPTDSDNVVCKLCKVAVSQGSNKGRSKNTSNLWHHLQSKHEAEYKKASLQKFSKKRTHTEMTQKTVTELFDKMKVWKSADPRSKNIDKLILEMIATDNLPFSVVQNIGFQRLISKLEPRYGIKSEKFYRTELFPLMYEDVRNKIKELMSEDFAGSSISFTTDCWSGNTKSMMSLTAHFINKKWKKMEIVLNIKVLESSHTGEYLASIFMEMLEDWQISRTQVFLILRDSGANVVRGINLVALPNLSCFAHSLQLVVNEGLKAQRAVVDVVSKIRRIATHFNHSILAKQRLRAIQARLAIPQHSILQSVPTRWNSVYIMLARAVEQKSAISLYEAEHGGIQGSVPSNYQWVLIENVINTLKPFQEITLEISKADATISSIIPAVRVLKLSLSDENPHSQGISTMRETMMKSIDKRFESVECCSTLGIACLLDPRYKGCPFESTAAKSDMVSELREKLKDDDDSDELVPSAPTNSSNIGGNSLDRMYAVMLQSSEASQHEDPSCELDRYLKESVCNRKETDVISWWATNSNRYPKLARIARNYLATPPTSVPSERVFSTMGQIYDDRRCSLLGINAEKLCFLSYNLKLLNFDY